MVTLTGSHDGVGATQAHTAGKLLEQAGDRA